jgi:hypothetical protein
MSECRFCGCAIDDAAAVVETATGVAHRSCVEPDGPPAKGRGADGQTAAEAVTEIGWRSRVLGL